MKSERITKFTPNRRRRTFTIRTYEGGRMVAKYRTAPQDPATFQYFAQDATEADRREFMRRSGEYYKVD